MLSIKALLTTTGLNRLEGEIARRLISVHTYGLGDSVACTLLPWTQGQISGYLKEYISVFLGFWPVFGQSWAQEPAQRPRLEKCCINQRKLTREIDSKTLLALVCVIGVVWAGPGPPV